MSITAQKRKKEKGEFFYFFSLYVIKHCFICRPSDSTVSEDAGIEQMTVAASALTARCSITTGLDLIHWLDLIQKEDAILLPTEKGKRIDG
jgi:hypothetical protein